MFLARTIELATRIEAQLRASGAHGIGLRELADSLPRRLDPGLRNDLREVMQVRNKLVHEHGYVHAGSEAAFLTLAESVADRLAALAPESSTSHPLLKETAMLESTRLESTRLESSALVEVHLFKERPSLTGRKHPSTQALRLVFFTGGVANPKAPGHWHSVPPFFSRVTGVGLVRMVPVNVTHQCELTLGDGVTVRAELEATLCVDERDDAIARVAQDALRNGDEEPRLALTALHRALIELAGKLDIRLLKDMAAMQRLVADALARVAGNPSALRIDDCLVKSLRPVDARMAQHAEEAISIRLEDELAGLREVQRLRELQQQAEIREIERGNRLRDAEQAGQLAAQQAAFELRMAQLQGDFEHKQRLEQLQMEQKHQIEMAQILAGTELSKVQFQIQRDEMRWKEKNITNEVRADLYEKVVDAMTNQQRVTLEMANSGFRRDEDNTDSTATDDKE